MGSAKTFLGAVAGRFLFRHGKTTSVTRLSEHFTRIDVAGKELEGAPFTPGDKVQLYLPDEGAAGGSRRGSARTRRDSGVHRPGGEHSGAQAGAQTEGPIDRRADQAYWAEGKRGLD